MSNFVVGLDIGYSNLVVSYGQTDNGRPEKTVVLPAGAGPVDLLPRDILGKPNMGEAALVQIDGEQWAAGVQPEQLAGMSRELHADYPATRVYQALFFAALALSERDVIDVLVTGLPVNQYNDPRLRQALVERLTGTHDIAPKLSVTVEKVIVVPQPAGTYLTALEDTATDDPLAASLDMGVVLVLDPGYFSVDWVTFEDGALGADTAGTDLRAMSRVIDATAGLLQEEYGIKPPAHRLEAAVRSQDLRITIRGKAVDFDSHFKRASRAVADSVLIGLRSSLRDKSLDTVDAIILGGGGGASYLEAAQHAFPDMLVVTIGSPVTSNSVGFWHCGR